MDKFEWVTETHYPPKYVFNKEQEKAWKENIVETAGFIPLEVRFKQMEQAGYRARFSESEFSSRDVTDMYLNHPEFDITPEDDYEDMLEKVALRNNYVRMVKEEVLKKKAESEMKLNESEAKMKQNETSAKDSKQEEKQSD